MSDVDRVERLLRSALVPVEPPEALSDRLERGLSELTEVAADELADWELVGDARPAQLGAPGGRGRGRQRRPPARSSWCAPASSRRSATTTGLQALEKSSARSRTTSRSACAASRSSRALERSRAGVARPAADACDPDQQVEEVVLGVHRDQVEDLVAVARDEAEQRHEQVDDAEAERVRARASIRARRRAGRSRRWRCGRCCASRSRRGSRARRRAAVPSPVPKLAL